MIFDTLSVILIDVNMKMSRKIGERRIVVKNADKATVSWKSSARNLHSNEHQICPSSHLIELVSLSDDDAGSALYTVTGMLPAETKSDCIVGTGGGSTTDLAGLCRAPPVRRVIGCAGGRVVGPLDTTRRSWRDLRRAGGHGRRRRDWRSDGARCGLCVQACWADPVDGG